MMRIDRDATRRDLTCIATKKEEEMPNEWLLQERLTSLAMACSSLFTKRSNEKNIVLTHINELAKELGAISQQRETLRLVEAKVSSLLRSLVVCLGEQEGASCDATLLDVGDSLVEFHHKLTCCVLEQVT